MPKKLTREEWIKKASDVYDNKYDYCEEIDIKEVNVGKMLCNR